MSTTTLHQDTINKLREAEEKIEKLEWRARMSEAAVVTYYKQVNSLKRKNRKILKLLEKEVKAQSESDFPMGDVKPFKQIQEDDWKAYKKEHRL